MSLEHQQSDASKYRTCRRYNDPGYAHSLTFSCFRGRPLLSRERTCKWMIDAIEFAREKHDFKLWAYVIMPEHVHLLIYPNNENYSINSILTSLKQPVSKKALFFVKQNAPHFLTRMTNLQPSSKKSIRFWQRGGGYDRNLSSPRYIWETIRYIHNNPVRRRLCKSYLDWQWSSAHAFLDDRNLNIKIDVESIPNDPRKIYE